MSGDARVMVAVDRGTATTAVALIGLVGGRWRLVGATAAPATVDADGLADRLWRQLSGVDPALAAELRLTPPVREARTLACRTAEAPTIAVVAASARVRDPLAAVAASAGWRVRPLAIAETGLLDTVAILADPSIEAVLAGASTPPGADERSLLPELSIRVGAAVARRPDLAVVLAGGLAEASGPVAGLLAPERPGPTVVAGPTAGDEPFGERLRLLLDTLRGHDDDGRRALVRAAGTLAEVLDRPIEVVEIGASGGTRASATPARGLPVEPRAAIVPAARLVPRDLGDGAVDAVAAWVSIPLDRLRLRDRLHELAIAPWADVPGDGAVLRVAAARAALERLAAATGSFVRSEQPTPELVVVAGGAWLAVPGPVVALAVADVLRRPGAIALGLDHARLLGPIGMIDDPDERRALVADLRDDLVAPLGSVLMPAGLRPGPHAGRAIVHGAEAPAELDLVPGGLELIDLPPGEHALVELRFRDPVELGARGRRFAIELTGGLGGLLIDLRDVPLRLPERLDRRRELLAAWEAAFWAGLDA